jgi:ABC-2 type transport system ATP-binding protein
MSYPAIESHGLTKYYGKSLGVVDLDFEVRPGEVFGFLGPNGAGKTTTIRLMVGLLNPSAGGARVLGYDLVKDSLEIRRRIGYIPGEVRLFPELTGEEALLLLESFQPDRPAIFKGELIQRFEIDPSRKIKQYSSGNKQKLAIVQAFMHDPDLLILDEPTATLDPLMRHRFFELIHECRDRGRTIFISSHILPEMESICDRVGIIRNGRLATVEDIRSLEAKKLRRAEFTLASEPAAEDLRFSSAKVERVEGLRFKADIAADMDLFVKELSRLAVSDLEVSHASLEDIFLEFYREEEDHQP